MPGDELRSREFRNILLIKLSAVGDVVHTIPVLNKLRRRYPAARLDWLVTPAIGELLQHNPAISNVIEFARDERSAPWRITPFAAAARLVRNCAPPNTIWSSICKANCAARFLPSLQAPRCASASTSRAPISGKRYRENPRGSAQARLEGRARS